MILYEYPFNERLRTYLRLEQLFRRLFELVTRESPVDHHFALATIFEIMEVAARADLKSDLLRDLDRHKSLFEGLRDNPAIAQDMLDTIIAKLEQCYSALHAQTGKTGQPLTENDWLMAIRSRIGIPGGTCEFDLPAYYDWQHQPPERRQQDLNGWVSHLAPLAEAIHWLLKLLRDAGSPQKVVAVAGQFQQNLPQGRSFQLLRVFIDGSQGLVPEISGNRLMFSVRMMRMGEDHRLHGATDVDMNFELSLCA